MRPTQKRKCTHCHTFFLPDARNIRHQQYCGKPACRQASKTASRRKWLQKPENHDYFRGPENVRRVRQWRATHPGYWRRKPSTSQTALQDLLTAQPFVLLGLIANFTGTALQDDIDSTLRRLQQLGRDIAHHYKTRSKGGLYDVKVSYCSPTGAPGAAAV